MTLLGPALESQLVSVQHRIASRVMLSDDFSDGRVAGVDQAFIDELVISGAVILCTGGKLLSKASHALMASMPYVPEFLSFREGPAAIKAVRALDSKPTLLFVDGCGINHPRKAGLASYVGVILDIPTIGITKSVLCGTFDLPERVGEALPLVYGNEQVGYLLKSCRGCRPIVVAPGHKISVDSALEMARRCLKGHKLPEPCRLAHEYANSIKKAIARAQAPAISSSSQAPSQNPQAPF